MSNNNNNNINNKVANAQHQHRQEESFDKIFNATDNLFNSMGDAAFLFFSLIFFLLLIDSFQMIYYCGNS